MLFQDFFQFFTFWDAVESGLYFIIVGYYFLIFAYFLLMRFRTSKKYYWLFFSLLFLFLAAGRVFFINYYFFTPELYDPLSPNPAEVVGILMIQYRLATFSTWMGIACLMGVFGILIFPPLTESIVDDSISEFKKKMKKLLKNQKVRILLRIVLFAVPVIVAILALTLSDMLLMDPDFVDDYLSGVDPGLITIFGYPIGRAVFNFILLPLFVAIIPFLFIYLAVKTFGVLRRSYALNAIGFLIYFLGRILQGLFDTLNLPHINAIMPPLLILLSLLIIVIANNYEQLR